ncbi:hypothetical protein Daus18300_004329 [Diaporthe australafricana]|uniref:DUF7770 domain-containing protein n=1 Tax=Diaporthe australafricana TaxID=127596 RepID=A0ABR3X9T0_9PEZI
MEELDGNWETDNFDPSTMSAPVEDIHLCALRNDLNEGDELGSPPTNHWVVCLQTSYDSSVMLDMVPGYGSDGLRGKIELAALNHRYTDETLRLFSFKPTETLTIGQLLAHISERRRQRFTFHPSWEGCRFWISVLMADWEELQLIAPGSAKLATEALTKYWINPEGSQPREMREGTFRE